jgi:hypothetical protein
MNKEYIKNGVLVISDVLKDQQIREYRYKLNDYLTNSNAFTEGESSRIIPGFAGNVPELGELNTLHLSDKVNGIIKKEIFDDYDYIYADHSDLHQNKITGWHRDTYDYLLKDRGNGTHEGLWSEECHIIKVCFLLQDHIDNNYGLWFKLGTHKSEIEGVPVSARTKATDMIIFDQRILHSGQTQIPRYHQIFNKNRYLLTYAYGLNNEHTKIHIKGATLRQNRQKGK